MNRLSTLVLSVALASASAPVFAQSDHQSHHPAAAAPVPTNTTAPSSDSKSAPDSTRNEMSRMHAQMTAMREMHEKMMAAKTPKERNALMAEDMKLMQEGMNMMSAMPDGQNGIACDTTARDKAMEERMQMMQTVMQMMMDRLPPRSVP